MPDDKIVLDPNRMYARLTEAGEDWADKKSAYHALDALTKTVLADVTMDYLAAAKSKAEAETRALAARPYKDHLAAVAQAHKGYLRAEVLYRNLQTLVELRRSVESTRRAEMRL